MYALPLFRTAASKHHTLDQKRKNLLKFAVLYLQFVTPKGCHLVINLQTLEDIRGKILDHMTVYINSITSFLAFELIWQLTLTADQLYPDCSLSRQQDRDQ